MSDDGFTPPGPPLEPTPTPPARAHSHAAMTPTAGPVDPSWFAHAAVRRPAGLAIAVQALAACLLALQLLQAVTAATAADVDGDLMLAYDLVSLPMWPIGIACYIVTCLWLQNSRAFSDASGTGFIHRQGKGWIWMGWLVPIAALVVPYRVVSEVYRSTQPLLGTDGLVKLWWCFWPTWQFVSYIALRQHMSGSDGFHTTETIGAALATGAFVCWILIVRRVDNGQAERELRGPGRA